MRMLLTWSVVAAFFLGRVAAGLPSKIYGVNLGSWLVLEPWMLPQEWTDMGGQICSGPCSECIGSEFSFVEAYPDTADAKFQQHWETWFTQDDVNDLASNGINTVRVPLGYWIIESLVDRKTEFFPRGGIKQLQRGLKQLKAAGINAILDHHAPPGVQDANQAFTGHCTTDVEFYTPYNYQRALVWTAVMTALSHLDSNFDSVFAIEAVNEPIMDATQTPGYGDFQQNFVQTIRAVEFILGVGDPILDLSANLAASSQNVTAAISATVNSSHEINPEVKAAILASIPILTELSFEMGFNLLLSALNRKKDPLVANFMDVNWQYNDPPNPADVTIGPTGYDNHLYYSFGGVADANEEAYMISICNLQRVQADAALGDSPLWFGEWGLPTQFNATDEFLYEWADAQKLMYSQGKGWIFWNFKTEISELAGDLSRQWSYLEGVKLGYLTKDPSKLNDPNVCAPYVGRTYTSTSTSASASFTSTSEPSASAASTTSVLASTTFVHSASQTRSTTQGPSAPQVSSILQISSSAEASRTAQASSTAQVSSVTRASSTFQPSGAPQISGPATVSSAEAGIGSRIASA
ncbi:glycoside hydrolase [Dichomitus squalens LYAD-421 SS1]|uniref:glycoside hydrolase n=1 Tax=Dichomitus squalens (strain LYAD-421) TaxID=732165 RepID=UPI0004410B02|nr:glycoside hydrolase [Dichomitus squalens LYAD-421 SS1]EJF64330.1 glycoside hydrolase [Dichomitus squalens LYAD-421 SS1]